MAALYLHHALFSPEPSPLLQQRNPNSDTEPPPGLLTAIPRSMSSISTVTLQASDSFKDSRHSESLLDPVSQEATTAFLDIPIATSGGLVHPSDSGPGWLNGPRLERDLSRPSSRPWPLGGIWRRLRRLKLFYALSYTLIVVWAIYNTIRYFLSFPSFFSRQRQIISLCLGTSTILCVAVLVSALLLATLNPCANDNPGSAFEYTRGVVLPYMASFLLLAPAIVNLVLVVVWRSSNDPQTTLRGRCRWDIDVVWSGVGLVCERSPSFGSWITGAVSRLCITSMVLITYHVVLHKYRMVCQAAEIIDKGPYTWFTKSEVEDRRKSIATAGSGRTRTSLFQSTADFGEPITSPPSAYILREPASHAQPGTSDGTASVSRSPHNETEMPEGISASTSSRSGPPVASAGPSFSHYEDDDLQDFVGQLRRMVDQATRDTEEGLDYSSPESSEESPTSSGGDHREFDPYTQRNLVYDANGRPIEVSVDPSQVQVFGRMVHRMPTITSIGSCERSSRAPSRAYSGHPPLGERSLPSSRSNTAENDVAGQLHSRQAFH